VTAQAPLGTPQAMKEQITGGFAEVADGYDAEQTEFFEPVAEWLVGRAGIRAGARVLDVGCGKGAVSIAAARAAGPDGHVTGIDLAEPMLEHARARAGDWGLANVTFQAGDAEATGFGPASFDVVLAGMAIQFLSRPAHAARHWLPLLDTGGVLAFSWSVAQDPRFEPAIAAVDAFVPDGRPKFDAFIRRPPFNQISEVEDMLSGAGYRSITTVTRSSDVTYRTPEEWWAKCRWMGPWVTSWRHIPPDRLPAAQAGAFRILDKIRAPDGSITRSLPFACTTAYA
jgi:ubiquinone/menaquinone biosynthesis C-methylase UbiE